MDSLKPYQAILQEELLKIEQLQDPENLYAPVRYIMSLGGKRLRPLLSLMACDAFGSDPKDAVSAAMAVEVFHNFTLVHDDIMDEAPLRRGKPTVHKKWDLNTGILSGDAMLILAYRYLENYDDSTFADLCKLFSKTALEVCEGQQYDMDFESRTEVSIPEYIRMIEYKTSVLVACALQMGAIVAGADDEQQKCIYEFGRNLGIAFQLKDDYLDSFGNPETFGKQVGGDIIENKKTYLYIKAMELGGDSTIKELMDLYRSSSNSSEEKIEKVKAIFQTTGSDKATEEAISEYTAKAYSDLDQLKISEEKKEIFREFANYLMNRIS